MQFDYRFESLTKLNVNSSSVKQNVHYMSTSSVIVIRINETPHHLQFLCLILSNISKNPRVAASSFSNLEKHCTFQHILECLDHKRAGVIIHFHYTTRMNE